MSIEKPDNERLELYNRFKNSLADNKSDELFFDADDLIVIYDQAVDLDDHYVQIEALMRGYRYFPDNSELATRRGFLYFSLNVEEGVNQMIAAHDDGSPLWKLLKVRAATDPNDPQAQDSFRLAILEELLNHEGKFDDETMIQLVDAAAESNNYKWLRDNEALLRKKAEYLPSLLYELFIVSDEQNDLPYGISLLEELTGLEPFNLDFWLALAQAQLRTNDYEGALSSADYALAIASDDPAVVSVKACALGSLQRFEDVVELVYPFIRENPTPDVSLVEAYLRACLSLSPLDPNIVEWCSQCAKMFPENRIIVGVAIDAKAPDSQQILETHYLKCTAEERDDWFNWGRRLFLCGRPADAALVLDVLFKKNLLSENNQISLFVSALYTACNYRRCIQVFDEIRENNHSLLNPDVAVAGLLATARIETKARCRKAFAALQKALPMANRDVWHLGSELETIGFSTFLGMFQAMLNQHGAMDVDVIDIFHLPAAYSDDFLDFFEQ